MSRDRGQLEFERYLDYQRALRPQRIETLGGAVTALVLATVDMGLSDVHDPVRHSIERHEPVAAQSAEVIPLRSLHERHLAEFATDAAELGYAQAA